ncbi:hypothetical protein FRC11_013287 [Ceratobasidium sp. 423]|nr:hypothetical protein FRC11_013287 [Ceratobasidium sp. 423]
MDECCGPSLGIILRVSPLSTWFSQELTFCRVEDYTGAVLTALMATLISSLAPAALSVGVIPVDKELTAFHVGAVASDSVVKMYLTLVDTNPKFNARATEAASMGARKYFQATSPKYGVPVLLDLQPTDRARYVMDVATMDPVCTWTVPNPPVVPVANASDYNAKALTRFSSDSGPEVGIYGVGRAAQFQMFFDAVDNSTLTSVLTPRPVEELTQGYMIAQQAAMRSYLSGQMASSFVPGRMQEMTLVPTSSPPHVIVSTILFTCAAIFINICYLRSNTEQFTLFSVAAALAHSNVGCICEDVKYAGGEQGALAEDVALKSLGDRKILLVNGGGPRYSLHME